MTRKRKRAGILFLIIATGVLLLILIYSAGYYRADDTALAAEQELTDNGRLQWSDGNALILPEEGASNGEGILFYPGGLVEARAYIPLLQEFADRGYTCVLLSLPFRLGFFDYTAAEPALETAEERTGTLHWSLMGHSLGGVAASLDAADRPGQYDHVFFLASYPAGDMGSTDSVILYGSEDHVLNRQSTEKAADAARASVTVIDGGNHGQFGDYGHQKGDGTAGISAAEQQEETAELVSATLGIL